MSRSSHALGGVCLLALASPAGAQTAPTAPDHDVLVIAARQRAATAPASSASVDAAQVETTVNALNVEDTLKYLPSLIVRKRHVGDTQAPLATRTSGLGSSARSLIYADGALLSALIGNNNTIASPRWSLVSPQEIARVDVLYGPFSAAYPGNSIGAVVNITTRLPDRLQATATAATSIQQFRQYGTDQTLPAYETGVTIGDRVGPLSLFASANRVDSRAQPLTYVTALGTGTPTGTTGGYADLNRLAMPIRVLGANAIEHQRQDQFKLHAALDLTPAVRLSYVGGLFLNTTDASAETYLSSAATGAPVYTTAFSGGVYHYEERHWSHALSATGTGARVDWGAIGTLYDFNHDVQRIPTTSLPGALSGGAGTITTLDGTGWRTVDAHLTWRSDARATNALTVGAHADEFRLASNRYTTTDWINGGEGALNLQSLGRTRTVAVWAEDVLRPAAPLTLTPGGRYEWWRAYGGVNFSATPAISAVQPEREAARFSPKASLAYGAGGGWIVRGSYGDAWRFPTVGELYQIVTAPVAAVPNPNLRPEHARSEELALEHVDARGSLRASLFNEVVFDALISQTGQLAALNGTQTLATFVQNVDRTRARGVELAGSRTDIVPRVDLSGSVTYADAITRADAALPGAVGKLLPSVPHWKATLVATWRPDDKVSLTAAGRYSSRNYGTIDNSDPVGNTYGGFYKYLVVDLRAAIRATERFTLGLGVDNVNNDRYFLFHPFPQRTLHADVTVRM